MGNEPRGMNRLAISRAIAPEMAPGRRDYLECSELGVSEASRGSVQAQITTAASSKPITTGWHLHLCEGEFVYMLRGQLKVELTGAKVDRVEAGDSIFIPGHTLQNATTSEDCEFLEVSVPAEMGTQACDPPN